MSSEPVASMSTSSIGPVRSMTASSHSESLRRAAAAARLFITTATVPPHIMLHPARRVGQARADEAIANVALPETHMLVPRSALPFGESLAELAVALVLG